MKSSYNLPCNIAQTLNIIGDKWSLLIIHELAIGHNTYKEIQNYVLEKFGFKVSNLYIAQVKEKCGIKERENYNKSKKEDLKQPICPIEKEEAIKDAFRYFQMI